MSFMRVISEASPMLLQGFVITVEITIISLLIAFVLGLVSCIMGLSKIAPLKWISKLYIWLIRGTPLLVQCFFVYLGLPQLLSYMGTDFRLTAFAAGVITLSLNAGAYMSEIFRGGIQAIDKGQMEAARSLGLPKGKAMSKVILPQALKISIPSLVNQFIITLKDTSIVSTISLAEVVYQARIYIGRSMESFATWSVVAIMYLVVVTILSAISNRLERSLDNARK